MADLAGNDIAQYIRKRKLAEDPTIKYSKLADILCEKGRLGQKTNAGWYDYVPGKRDAIPSQEVLDMITSFRDTNGIKPRKISNEEIVQRLVYALVNEGAKILEEGIAARSSDIDVVYIFGYGFPPFRGGPMHYANEQGLLSVVSTMQGFAKNKMDDQAFWTPAPLLAKLASEGKRFA
jgi:3-hydroxyacyl-CoA dehydrogenase